MSTRKYTTPTVTSRFHRSFFHHYRTAIRDHDDQPGSRKSSKSVKTTRNQIGPKWLCFTKENALLLLSLPALAIFVILLAVATFVVAISSDFQICTSTNCAYQAGIMLTYMNTSADPCNDFYNYACGNLINVDPAPPTVNSYKAITRLKLYMHKVIFELLRRGSSVVRKKNSTSIAKTITFYKSCMNIPKRNEHSIAQLLDFIKELGGWTLTNAPTLSPSWSFLTTMIKINDLGIACPLKFVVKRNRDNPTKNILELIPSGWYFSENDPINKDKSFEQKFMRFSKYIIKLLGTIGNGTPKDLNTKLKKLWELEKKMALRGEKYSLSKMNVSRLQSTVIGSGFNVFDYLKALFGYQFNGSEVVRVKKERLIKYIIRNVSTIDKGDLANLMILKVLWRLSDKLTLVVQQHSFTNRNTAENPLWMDCLKKAKLYFPNQLAAMYVDSYFDEEYKTEVEKMVIELKEAMRHLIRMANWMDKTSKEKALKKMHNILYAVAYPDNLFDLNVLDKPFQSIQIDETTYFLNCIKLMRVRQNLERIKLGKPVDRAGFGESIIDVNAFYSQTGVAMKVLVGILTYPIYDPRFFWTTGLGMIGSVIGHELNHAFDAKGKKYDENGRRQQWWTKKTSKRYKKRVHCFIRQYSKYHLNGMKSNGKKTLSENIADCAGMQAALMAFNIHNQRTRVAGSLPGLKMDKKKLFFLGFAQRHCTLYTKYGAKSALKHKHSPNPLRMLGTLSNTKEFAEVFQCPAGSVYNPSKRCSLW